MLEEISRLSEIFERALPPYAADGPVATYFVQPVEFGLCAHYGRLDVFHQRYFGTDESAKRPFADILREFKQTKPDDMIIAQGMIMTSKLSKRIPIDPETKKMIEHEFGHLLKGMPRGPQRVLNYFTEQHALFNFGERSHRVNRPSFYDDLPDRSLSTHLLCQHANPRTSLIACDVTGVVFKDDGVFFEGANFRAADMQRTEWHPSTSIKGALLEGADLSGAKGLTEEMLAECYIDKSTRLPAYLNRAKIAKMHAALDLPPAPPFTDIEAKYMPKARKPKDPAPGGMA